MSVFIPRRRRVVTKEPGSLKWPARATVTGELSPADLFGEGPPCPRSIIVHDSKGVTGTWNANIGRIEVKSGTFMPPLSLNLSIRGAFDVQFAANRVTISFKAQRWEDLDTIAEWVEFYIPAYASVFFHTYVGLEGISGTIEPDIEFRWELDRASFFIPLTNEAVRESTFSEVVGIPFPADAKTIRLLLAALYYQQAERLRSVRESRVSELNTAEILLNLSKSLEVLFGSRDATREGCAELGFTKEEIESQVIPILLLRSKIDVAHPVARRMPATDVEVLRDYAARAISNVQAVLHRAVRAVTAGRWSPQAIAEDMNKERAELMARMRSYLEERPLRGEIATTEPGSE